MPFEAMNRSSAAVLILASTSPRRQQLIHTLGLPVTIKESNVDETVSRELSPPQIVETLALRKASAAASAMEPSPESKEIVIGADTVVVLDGEVLGKPANEDDAARMLTMLQGRSHEVYSGVACIDLATGRQAIGHRVTKVKMKALSEEAIRSYIQTGEPSDKAGAYGIQGLGATIVDSIEGCYFNVVGLPLSLLSDLLAELDIRILG